MTAVELLYLPVGDLQRALAFYRDTLGWPEVWREGESTASLQLPGGQLQMMLDEQNSNAPMRAGPMLSVDDVRAWCRDHPELPYWLEPAPIPGRFLAGFEDSDSNA